jgi:anthranilate phosphoribosyltransferase
MTGAATTWPDILGPLVRGEDLNPATVEAALSMILEGQATDAQIAGFAVALRAKGETVEELTALVRTMVRFATPVVLGDLADRAVDTCGTGGDRSGTVNVSTVAALVVAGAGGAVVKHGNRAQSSKCGSADVLEALGVTIDVGPDTVAACVRDAGIGFCLAPRYHPSLRFPGPARRELGIPTTFNFLGPLANPARVRRQVVGISDPAMAPTILGALDALGAQHALVVYGHDGLDELTTTTTSTVHELRDGETRTYDIDPTALGLGLVGAGALVGGDATTNARISREVLEGATGPVRDIVLLNAAAGLVVADLAADLVDGIALAASVLDDGSAAGALERLVAASGAVVED